ncbi:MAG: monovalent cation/H(+) antiporter subunit G [Campylobacterota bacterium]|nr:monovalent cation/H(+) antiporter subunit G [Campylobacterota bacterium]
MLDILGYTFIFIGALILILASIGLLRMPDTITRMHAGTKASTLGTLFVIAGAICLEPALWFKLILLALFILLTNPLSSSILARSTYFKNGFLNKSNIDEMGDRSC